MIDENIWAKFINFLMSIDYIKIGIVSNCYDLQGCLSPIQNPKTKGNQTEQMQSDREQPYAPFMTQTRIGNVCQQTLY